MPELGLDGRAGKDFWQVGAGAVEEKDAFPN